MLTKRDPSHIAASFSVPTQILPFGSAVRQWTLLPCNPEFVDISSNRSPAQRHSLWSVHGPQDPSAVLDAQSPVLTRRTQDLPIVCCCLVWRFGSALRSIGSASRSLRPSNQLPGMQEETTLFERSETIVVVASNDPSPAFESKFPSRYDVNEPS